MQDKLMTSSYSPVLTTKAVKDEYEAQILRDAHVRPLHTDKRAHMSIRNIDDTSTNEHTQWYICYPVRRLYNMCESSSCVFCVVVVDAVCRSGMQSPSSSCWCGWRSRCRWGGRLSWQLQNTSTCVAGENANKYSHWGIHMSSYTYVHFTVAYHSPYKHYYSKQSDSRGPSFETISASGPNAALAHYR